MSHEREDSERAEFERLCRETKPVAWETTRFKSGSFKGRYTHPSVEFMWRGWLARAVHNGPPVKESST